MRRTITHYALRITHYALRITHYALSCRSTNLNHGDQPEMDAPPDIAAAGDVTTTGHSSHDVQAQAGDAHAGHGPADTSDQSTLVPTTWTQLIFPAIILLFV